mmetsp:Transcript_49053/g.91274  ORF Transcript_49053/g.91274 Transcript_49053/m.91274 type:complete len:251 (-) Transcript_49053:298-1050(-)
MRTTSPAAHCHWQPSAAARDRTCARAAVRTRCGASLSSSLSPCWLLECPPPPSPPPNCRDSVKPSQRSKRGAGPHPPLSGARRRKGGRQAHVSSPPGGLEAPSGRSRALIMECLARAPGSPGRPPGRRAASPQARPRTQNGCYHHWPGPRAWQTATHTAGSASSPRRGATARRRPRPLTSRRSRARRAALPRRFLSRHRRRRRRSVRCPQHRGCVRLGAPTSTPADPRPPPGPPPGPPGQRARRAGRCHI